MNKQFLEWASSAIALVFAMAPSLATAADGRLEINQTCAAGDGCFPGDSADFPVQITSPGSYVLTGPLTVPADTSGIVISAQSVGIDLNGFTISGTGYLCLEGNCPWDNTGPEGIKPINGLAAQRTTVRNGKVQVFSNHCVHLGDGANVSDLQVLHCGGNGITVGDRSVISRNTVTNTGLSGLYPGSDSVYTHNTLSLAGLSDPTRDTVNGGRATGGNFCDDAACDPLHRPMYYLNKSLVQGDAALAACDDGFHMASLWEIFDISVLRYSESRGQTDSDSGFGPPVGEFALGWVRTGGVSLNEFNGGGDNNPGIVNCFGWSSNSDSLRGTAIGLPARTWTDPPADEWIAPWVAETRSCAQATKVWCIQD